MQYFDFHIGDHEKATAHLTACEDGIYGRLVRRHLDTEKPLPADIKAVARLARARTQEELRAVTTMLDEFFYLTADGWVSDSCLAKIAKFQDKSNKAKSSANARWSNSDRTANGMRTHSEGNANQQPRTNNQEPEQEPTHPTPDYSMHEQSPRIGVGTPQGIAAAALNRLGVRVTSQDPNLIAACQEGVTADALVELHYAYPDKPAPYLITTARRLHSEGAKPVQAGVSHASPIRLSTSERVRAQAIEGEREDAERAGLVEQRHPYLVGAHG